MIYRLFKSAFTDRLAYLTATAAAVWWFMDMRYPALIPAPLNAVEPLSGMIAAGLAAGLFIAKHVFIAGHARIIKEIVADNSRLQDKAEDLKKGLSEARAERDLFSERERFLKDKLRCYEEKGRDHELSSVRKQLRVHENDTRTTLSFLVRDLKERLSELDCGGQEELERAVRVLRKELDLLDDEVKLQRKPLFEMALKITEIRENIFDLTTISMPVHAAKAQPEASHAFTWMSSRPETLEHDYKFLKVAFHPDRFPSEVLKDKAVRYFQQINNAYHSMKEKAKA